MKKFVSISHNKRDIFIAATAIALALSISIAYANVFVYMPIGVSIQPVSPPVKFDLGSGAGKPDLGPGNTITVNFDASNTSLDITIHPTFRVSYYKNLSIVINTDTKAYYLYFRVETPASLPAGSVAKLCVYPAGAVRSLSGWPDPDVPSSVTCISLTSTGTSSPLTLSAGGKVEIDVYVRIPPAASVPSSTTAQLHLIYTPTAETPP
ncbi:MAG: hypothetical protein QXI64_00705 [Sulfolobales archaeon]